MTFPRQVSILELYPTPNGHSIAYSRGPSDGWGSGSEVESAQLALTRSASWGDHTIKHKYQ